jgi:Domain of unknown function (DUF4157)
MNEDGRSAADGTAEATTALADRWCLPALDIVRRWTPGRPWLRFAAAVQERNLAAFVRAAPKRRDQGQGLGADLRHATDAPALPDFGDAMPISGLRSATPVGPWPSDAAAISRRRPRSRPESQTRFGALERVFRTTVARGSAPADSQGAGAGTRADEDRIEERLLGGALHGLARTLEPHVQGYLSRLLDLRIPAVRIHTGQAADAAARRLNADAVTFGHSIMFRTGKFDPDSATGLALLGHELTHVARGAHTEEDRSAGPPGRAALMREELAALENEQRVLQDAARKPVLTAPIGAMPREPTSRASRSTPAPRAATVDRAMAAPPAEGGLSSPPELSPQQLGALKEAIYRDLMDRIRTEFERGA